MNLKYKYIFKCIRIYSLKGKRRERNRCQCNSAKWELGKKRKKNITRARWTLSIVRAAILRPAGHLIKQAATAAS